MQSRVDAVLAGYEHDETTARRLLMNDDAPTRSSALRALARMHRLQESDVVAMLSDVDAQARCAALEMTCAFALSFGPDAPRALSSLVPSSVVPLLHDDDARVVELAAFVIGELSSDEITDDEMPASETSGTTARVSATTVRALCEIAEHHNDALARESAIAALGATQHEDALPTLLRALHDKPAIRKRALIALAPFDGLDVQEALTTALSDRDPSVRQLAEDLLAAASVE